MSTIEHVLSGAGAPELPPPSLGAHYIDTTTGDLYQATGTSEVGDWRVAVSDSGWVPVPALNGYASPPEMRKINGVVYLRGFSWLGSSDLGESIAQLPEGWRPGANQNFTKTSGSRVRRLTVSPDDGEISVSTQAGDGNGDYFEFDGILWPVN